MKTEEVKKEIAMHDKARKKQAFLEVLAAFLVENQGVKSIKLQMGDPLAVEWAALRNRSPLMGYPTLDEAKIALRKFLQ